MRDRDECAQRAFPALGRGLRIDRNVRRFALRRMAAFPDVPTLAEQGLPNYSFFVYMGLVAPAGTPRE